MIIGITGLAQHGKDTVGKVLVENYGFTKFAFADALKQMALVLDPWIPDARMLTLRLSELVQELGWEGAKQNSEVRRFLQVLGTEGVRDIIGEDSWVNALARTIPDGSRAVITDVRFPNEAKYVDWLIRVVRPNFDNGLAPGHASEQFVNKLPARYLVVNDTSIEDLGVRVSATIELILAIDEEYH